MHGKIIGFDEQNIFVGSFNIDARSVVLNTELGAYFESPEYATYLSNAIKEKGIAICYQVMLTDKDNLEW